MMTRDEEIGKAIEALPDQEFERLREWFAAKDFEKWDEEIEADSEAGRLGLLVKEARDAKKYGELKDLYMHRTTARFRQCFDSLPPKI